MSHYKNKVIIFAHPRSGSTSLYKILNTHPVFNLAMEPFHKNYGQWNPNEKKYIDHIQDIPSFQLVLAEIFEKYNGMKMLSYQLPEELYDSLFKISNCKILVLTRTNVLKTIVSNLIAEQTKVWQKSDLNQQTTALYHDIKPLEIDGVAGIESRIKSFKEHICYLNEMISRKPAECYMKISYEDLYTKGMDNSFSYIKKIFDFLDLDMPDKEKLIQFIDPKLQQINDVDTYKLVPNIEEINNRFSNTENGFLL